MNVVFGAGGVAREVAWILHEYRQFLADQLTPDAFIIADSDWAPHLQLGNVPVISESTFLKQNNQESTNIFLGLGLPNVKQRVISVIGANEKYAFPNLIHSKSSMDLRSGKVTFGRGVVVYPFASLTTDVSIGDFVHINPGATVAHESNIGSFSTLCPGSHISGRVSVGPGCFIGAGAVIRESLSIAGGCVIGAGAVVVKSISEPGTWIGVPARKLCD
jgi:sugar O-acyltransferase (sialic acid O-acetyltransferase NeuD family)